MSSPAGVLLEENEEMDRQLREVLDAVQKAEVQLRNLASELGQGADEVQKMVDEIKMNPADFSDDPGRARKEFAEAVLRKSSVEARFAEQLRASRDAEARAARAESRREEEAAVFAKYVQLSREQVQLSVGGETFTTSKSVMLAADEGSLFEVLFSGRQGTPPSPLFIDRDPSLFVYVLRFLRAAEAGQSLINEKSLAVPENIFNALVEEARFFGLKSLETALVNNERIVSIFMEMTKKVETEETNQARMLAASAQFIQTTAAYMLLYPNNTIVQKVGAWAISDKIRGVMATNNISGGRGFVLSVTEQHAEVCDAQPGWVDAISTTQKALQNHPRHKSIQGLMNWKQWGSPFGPECQGNYQDLIGLCF